MHIRYCKKGFSELPVLPKHTLFKVLYFILSKFKIYTLFIPFFSQILKKILYYRKKFSKRIKSHLFILFSLKHLIHPSLTILPRCTGHHFFIFASLAKTE